MKSDCIRASKLEAWKAMKMKMKMKMNMNMNMQREIVHNENDL